MLKLHTETITPYAKIATAKTNTKQNSNMTGCINFKGGAAFPQPEFNDIINKKQILNDEISAIYKKDRKIISENFMGEIKDEQKFFGYGYYLYLKENNNEQTELYNYLKSLNSRKLEKDYKNFYQNNLISAYKVKDNKVHYLDNNTNKKISAIPVDEYIEKELDNFFINKMQVKTTEDNVTTDEYLDTEFAQKRLNSFLSLFKENPLFMTNSAIQQVFGILNLELDNVNKNEYDFIYKNLDDLSEALYTNDTELLLNSWSNIRKSTIDFYKNSYLKEICKEKDEKIERLNNFLNSSNYKILNSNNKLAILFEYRGSGELTLSEKVFLIDKYQQAEQDRKSYGIDMLDFLANSPANNKIRKQIVKNLIESQEFANENFTEIKKLFVKDIEYKEYNSNLFDTKINNENIVDAVLKNIDESLIELPQKNKVDYLSEIAEEDIVKILEKLRTQWLKDKFVESLNFESDKYDMSKQTDLLISALTVNHNGKNIPINEFLDDAVKTIYGANADLKKISEDILKYEKANNKNLAGLFIKNKEQYDAIMSQLQSVITTLSKNNASSEAYFLKISKELDKLEMNCPWLKPQVKDTRSVMEKLKDGIWNKHNVIPSVFIYNILSCASSCGEPHTMSLAQIVLFIFYGFNIMKNINNEFRKA